MRCLKCGAQIPEGDMYCPKCGSPIQLVPDYTSLENLLADEVKEALGEKPSSSRRRYDDTDPDETVFLSRDAREQSRSYDDEDDRYEPSSYGKPQAEQQRRRRQNERLNRRKKQKKKLILILVLIAVAIVGIVSGVTVYGNSYTAKMHKAEKVFEKENYEKALSYYTSAGKKKQNKCEPYVGIGKCDVKLGDTEGAETAFLKAIELDADCSDSYLALCEMYESLGQTDKIADLLADVDSQKVLKACADYVAPVPEISPEGGELEDETQVTITAASGTIHYTTDNTQPTANSPVYSQPIDLKDDGHYVIRAVVINDKGIAGQEASAEYTIAIPLVEGPSVSPASGTYDEATEITVSAASGMKIYYTLDGTTPTTSSSVYTKPIEMPEGDTTFSCIAVSESGRTSSVIKRQYSRYTYD